MSACRVWLRTGTTVVNAKALTRDCGVVLVDTSRLTASRVQATIDLAEAVGVGLVPEDAEVAEWVETLAGVMQHKSLALSTWASFYDDLPLVLESGESLQGRPILYSADGTLAACNEPLEPEAGHRGRRRRHRSAFFSPRARGEADELGDTTDDALTEAADDERVDISTPRSLKNRIVFMHPELSWYEGTQRRQRPGREFLETEHLVQPFRTERLLGLLRRVMAESPTDAAVRDSLHFAFRLLGGQPERHRRDLRGIALRVPTLTGTWIPASEARFGNQWSPAGSSDLTLLAESATPDTPELASLPGYLVAAPAKFEASGSSEVTRWTSFLITIGVTATLPVLRVAETRSIIGRQLTASRLTGTGVPEGVPSGVVEQWRAGLPTTGNPDHPETIFTTGDPLCWLLGQHEVASLPTRVRERYAHAVLRTVPSLTDRELESTWRRKNPYGVDSVLPTPAASFLWEHEWVPNQNGGDTPTFRAPRDSWYVAGEDQMAAYYSPLVESRLRRTLDGLGDPQAVIARTRMRAWGSKGDAAALVDHLTDLLRAREIDNAAAAAHVRSSLASAWAEIGNPNYSSIPDLAQGLLVERRGRLQLIEASEAGEESIFVTAVGDTSTTAKLVRELGWPIVSVDTDDDARLHEVAEVVLQEHWHEDVVITRDWELEVLTQDQPWRPDPDARQLIAELPWLPLVVACTMRYPRSISPVGRNLDRRLDELARLRLVKSPKVSVMTGTGQQSLPDRLRGVLPMPGITPTLLVETAEQPLTWGQLEPLASSALELMGETRFAAELALTLGKLATSEDAAAEAPDSQAIADALGVETLRIAEMEARLFGSVSMALARLTPAAVCLWGEAALDALNLDGVVASDDVLAALVSVGATPEEAARVLRVASDLPDANDVRIALGITLVDYNRILEHFFPAIGRVDNSLRHGEDFMLRLSQRRPDLLNWMRASRLEDFNAGRPQPDWSSLRELEFLTPDIAWGSTLDELHADLIDERIDSSMAERFGPRPQTQTMPDSAEVRQANGAPLRERLAFLQKLAIAWHRKNESQPTVDLGVDFATSCMRALDAVGALDFVILSDAELVAWLHRVGCWPDSMPLHSDAESLGLTTAELDEAETERDSATNARLRAERQVTVHGSVLDLEPSMSNLIDQLTAHLARSPKSLVTPYRFTVLQPQADTRRRQGGRKPSSGGTPRPHRLSDAQRDAIGVAGELTAFHWLQRTSQTPIDESSWKSTYASMVYEGAVGDDRLGYDFEVPRSGGSVMYEVKATQGEAGTIELGESEVLCAQQHARSRRWRLLVVEEVFSTEPRVLMLPNPFGRDSRGLYRFVGNGVRLRFKL